MLISCIVQSLTVHLMRVSEWLHLYSCYGICGWLAFQAIVAIVA